MILDLGTLREYVQVPGDADFDILQQIAERVESRTEEMTGLRFETHAGFEQLITGGGRNLWPEVGPIQSITTIEMEDSGAEVTTSYYSLEKGRKILRAYGDRWPDQRYRVTADVGYASADDVPVAVLGAMYGLAARMYDNRGGRASESTGEHSITWMKLQQSDEMQTLRDYAMGCPV